MATEYKTIPISFRVDEAYHQMLRNIATAKSAYLGEDISISDLVKHALYKVYPRTIVLNYWAEIAAAASGQIKDIEIHFVGNNVYPATEEQIKEKIDELEKKNTLGK